jgi:pectin methylesterase-like acyl-CoA thioesterase
MNYWFGDSSDVIHVAKTGNDGNSGFAAQYPVNFAADAKLTIASALSVVPDGGTIIVWPGTYNEQVDIRTTAKSITMMGTNKHKCIISFNTASGPSATVYGYTKCKFANLSIIQTGAGKALDCEGQHRCEFEDLYISSSGIDGLYLMLKIPLSSPTAVTKGLVRQGQLRGQAAAES